MPAPLRTPREQRATAALLAMYIRELAAEATLPLPAVEAVASS